MPRPGSALLRAIYAATVSVALAASAISMMSLNREAHRRVDERTDIQRLRSDLVRVQAVGWHGLAEGAPDFTINSQAKALRARVTREAHALPELPGGPSERVRVIRLVDELLRGVDSELVDLQASTTLQGSSDLLDAALEKAERHASEQASSANSRLLRGALIVLGVAAALAAVFVLLIRRVRRRGDERFRALVEQSGEILLVLDADGRVTDVTAAAVRRTLGWEAAPLIGRRVDELVEAIDAPRARDALERLRQDPGPRPSFEVAVRDAHGELVHLEAIGNNLLATPAVGGLVLTLRDVSERRAMEDALRHQAFHDGLTGLPNRALFDDRLAQALARARRGEAQVAVVLVDLDDFKAVNDSLGHAAGDELLVACARRFDGIVRAADTAARLGGDEFAVLVTDTKDVGAAAADVAARLREALDLPFAIDDRMLHVAASVGVAVAEPGVASPLDVVRNADIAMYQAKERGGDELVAFEPRMLRAARERLDLREDLRGALERGELAVHYQPVVGLGGEGDGGTVAVEALMRWTHPEHGDVSPARFIPVAEETGMIVALGAWVLERACRDLPALQAGAPGVRIGVNVSAVQLREPSFPEEVRAILARTGVAADDVVLELTESVFADDEQVAGALRALRDLGVALSVDDFGTGYSSLSYLRRLDVDSVKIDRSFVAGLGEEPRDAALVRSIIELGHALGLTMVAEGVEDEDQERFLRDAGCDLAQGWLFGRPAPLVATARS
ncbi:MAG TPA: EAL domain-containing protein [Baekduia sp.]|nr:EAL domain-containing protein [Baekduia sp.]